MKQNTDFSNVETLRAFLRFHNEKAEELKKESIRHARMVIGYREMLKCHEPKGEKS